MASSSLTHHLYDTILHFCDMLLFMPQTTNIIARDKRGIKMFNRACQEASTNVGPQKAFNVVYGSQAMVVLKKQP